MARAINGARLEEFFDWTGCLKSADEFSLIYITHNFLDSLREERIIGVIYKIECNVSTY